MSLPLIFYSEQFLNHQTAGHPESPERLKAIFKQLESSQLLKHLQLKEPGEISREYLTKLHAPDYLEQLEKFCRTAGSGVRIDEDTVVSTGSWQAALKGAGSAIEMIDQLLGGNYNTAFSLVRPPGHHAMPAHTMGFCLFNNIALAARHALDLYGLERILILDWDAHHGNATEHMFYQDPRVFTVSWHQTPNWPPNSGALEDMGAGPGLGYNLNIPLPVDYGDQAYLQTFEALILPLTERFQPQLILVAAGYDAHHADILTQMGLTSWGFAALTQEIMKLAECWTGGKVGFFLEGGYQTTALAYAVSSTVHTLMAETLKAEKEPFANPLEVATPEAVAELIGRIKNLHPFFKEPI